jgi:hypothetical protein
MKMIQLYFYLTKNKNALVFYLYPTNNDNDSALFLPDQEWHRFL